VVEEMGGDLVNRHSNISILYESSWVIHDWKKSYSPLSIRYEVFYAYYSSHSNRVLCNINIMVKKKKFTFIFIVGFIANSINCWSNDIIDPMMTKYMFLLRFETMYVRNSALTPSFIAYLIAGAFESLILSHG